jgi:hypothetical protein
MGPQSRSAPASAPAPARISNPDSTVVQHLASRYASYAIPQHYAFLICSVERLELSLELIRVDFYFNIVVSGKLN